MSECTGQNSPDGRHKWIIKGKAHKARKGTISAGLEGEIHRQIDQLRVEPRQVCEYCGEDRYNYLDVNI